MKKVISLFYLLGFVIGSNAQLHDAQWMLGWSPNSQLDFRSDTPVVTTLSKVMPLISEANAAISDANGDLLFYTNGIYIAGKQSNGDSILNGNGLSPCAITDTYKNSGIPLPQAVLFLNQPGSNRYYYLFHFSLDSTYVYTLYYSVIDAQGDFGRGEVITKNNVFFRGFSRLGGIAACKHANGRDWWVVIPGHGGNLYRKFLLTPDGIADTLTQNVGVNFPNGTQSYARFSLDGTKYVVGPYVGKIAVFDFDRCTGQFSNPVTINNPDPGFGSGVSSVEFSPNGRFVYAIDPTTIKQYDLQNANIQDSILIYRCGCADGYKMWQFALAHDGRIYGSTWAGGAYYLHIINYPDSLGLACNFVYGGQPTLSDNSVNVSNTANPRLGPLVGSGCDTITTASPNFFKSETQIRVQPNPTDKAFYIEMPMQGNYVFELTNKTGQIVERRETKQVDIINTENTISGIYFLTVRASGSNKVIALKKVVVQH